jgi:hypothetical protein
VYQRVLWCLLISVTPAFGQSEPGIPSITITISPPATHERTVFGPTPVAQYCQGWNSRGMAVRDRLTVVHQVLEKSGLLDTDQERDLFKSTVDAVMAPEACDVSVGIAERLPSPSQLKSAKKSDHPQVKITRNGRTPIPPVSDRGDIDGSWPTN